MHARGLPGPQVCARLTALVDDQVMRLTEDALHEFPELRDRLALVPLGGYGRRDMAPFSDVDVMLLHRGADQQQMTSFVKRWTHDIYDAGLAPGHSVRTVTEAMTLARGDASICTSLIEARFLHGDRLLFDDFRAKFAKMLSKRYRGQFTAIVEARRSERMQFGETAYLLAPNVKRSRGALRDIQLLRWIAFARFGSSEPHELFRRGILARIDFHRLSGALEFLLQLRNELHFHAGKVQDVLLRTEQVRIAQLNHYRGREGVLPVEQFMQDYFRHTTHVRYLTSRFVESLRPPSTVSRVLDPMLGHVVDGDYRIGMREIEATEQGLNKLTRGLGDVLRLAELASLYDKRIGHRSWDAVHQAAPAYADELSPEVAARFVSILSQPAQLGTLLRRLHDLGVLEKIIPAFRHARCLLQFNEYHKYTVDEHSLRAVEAASDLFQEKGVAADVYRGLGKKWLLHLALLLHDLGKGFVEDHSLVGARIAADVARRLGLDEQDAHALVFLVREHLTMSHLALRRNVYDDELVLRYARQVGTPEMLKMLFVLTRADLAAVGPGVLNGWKVELLTELYKRTLRVLTGDSSEQRAEVDLERRRQEVREQFPAVGIDPELADRIDAVPEEYLRTTPTSELINLLLRIQRLRPGSADAWGAYRPELQATSYTIVAEQGTGRGIFARLTGALASCGLTVLSAEINSLGGDLILDRFVVHDADFRDCPPKERMREVSETLIQSLGSDEPPKLRSVWVADRSERAADLSALETRIKIDNTTSADYTIIEIFAFDRPGLLYQIARRLHQLQLSVGLAKIATYLDQVVDVFYLTDWDGNKLAEDSRLGEMRDRLMETLVGDDPASESGESGNVDL